MVENFSRTCGSAALATAAICATAQTGLAALDPTYACEVTTPQVIATDEDGVLELQAGDTVRIQYFHHCVDGYCAAHIWAPKGTSYSAWSSAFTSDTSLLPKDKVEGRRDGRVTWHHSNNGDRSDMVKIQLDCQSGTGLY
ncbi:hypothetical protein [Leisingera sp. ANG-M1]|uniref:hypothetical protein n=1 Tax=Leisingera sp. ANG-M1 TaxID=1577895 RepID=UPI00126A0153|nr:hypothetical protein [Leisingera sp. ANG-M1]